MQNKLPEVGKRYKPKTNKPMSKNNVEIIGVPRVLHTEGNMCLKFFLDNYEELPEDNSSQSEIEKAKEELKLWVDGANTDLIDKNSDIWTLFKKAQNLINALDNIKTQAESIVDNKMEGKLPWKDVSELPSGCEDVIVCDEIGVIGIGYSSETENKIFLTRSDSDITQVVKKYIVLTDLINSIESILSRQHELEERIRKLEGRNE